MLTTQTMSSSNNKRTNMASIRANLQGLMFQKEAVSPDNENQTSSNSTSSTNAYLGTQIQQEEVETFNHPKSFIETDQKKNFFATIQLQKIAISQFKPQSFEQIKEIQEQVFEIFGNFKDLYEECEILGQGASAIVKRCVCKNTNKEFAVKIVNTAGDEELELLIQNEFVNRRKINHKNIVNVHKLYFDRLKNKVYVIMELVKGKELFDLISQNKSISETQVSQIFHQLLTAIQYIHSKGIVHRDIKPQNILISEDFSIVKLTDFNVSRFTENPSFKYSAFSKENMKMWTYTGTEAYLAPEVIEDLEYTEMVDLWGAGIVLFMLLVGQHPFLSQNSQDLIKEITNCKIEYKDEIWNIRSFEARDLVSKLLEKDYTKRYSAIQALKHPWINAQQSNPENHLNSGDPKQNSQYNKQIELTGLSPSETLRINKLEKDRAVAFRARFICRIPKELETQI